MFIAVAILYALIALASEVPFSYLYNACKSTLLVSESFFCVISFSFRYFFKLIANLFLSFIFVSFLFIFLSSFSNVRHKRF